MFCDSHLSLAPDETKWWHRVRLLQNTSGFSASHTNKPNTGIAAGPKPNTGMEYFVLRPALQDLLVKPEAGASIQCLL